MVTSVSSSGRVTLSNNLWDMAAGVVIIRREAGAVVLDLDGERTSTPWP
jgi:fructose-1,6-bisphosphatase/inositol monophosphatase family enzyme